MHACFSDGRYKPGLWTLEWTVDWTMDWIMDSILELTLDWKAESTN